MTSEGLGRCLKVTLQSHAPKISAHFDEGPSGGSSVRRQGSEDPHQREWNSLPYTYFASALLEVVVVHEHFDFPVFRILCAPHNGSSYLTW
jgi:hypothetical protein